MKILSLGNHPAFVRRVLLIECQSCDATLEVEESEYHPVPKERSESFYNYDEEDDIVWHEFTCCVCGWNNLIAGSHFEK
jgi:hypothetical protein